MELAKAIYMVPMPLGSLSAGAMLHGEYISCISGIRCWIAENARTFRRFISSLDRQISIDGLEIFELHRDYSRKELEQFLASRTDQGPVGVVSEAGVPGMADPGAVVAAWAHRRGVPVIPVSGPSSLILALTASGLNGQQFTFHGYPPVKDAELKTFLQNMDARIRKSGYTEILIEAPYRSDRLLSALTRNLSPQIRLCVACALHEPNGWIRTLSVADWSKALPEIGRQPCIFLAGT